MIKIRKEQADAFLPKSDQEITKFIVDHLNEESPELIDRIPKADLLEMIANGIKRARNHGLRSLVDLTGFVSIMFEIAPNFDTIPEFHDVLSDERIPQDERFSNLFDKKFDKAWEKASNLDDDKSRAEAWFPELGEELD